MKKVLFFNIIINLLINQFIFPASITQQIIIDQIGYRPNADKWFMIADPRTGQNAAVTYVPGATVQLRRSSDNTVMQTITLTSFNNGNEYAPAGDVVWQGNFSSFTTPGTYHIYDPTNNMQSYNFDIGDNVYNTILRQAVKSYYYQRCGTAITSTYGGTWTHAACHTQQQNALLYDGGVIQMTQRNVSGGWHDAGDYRKYVTFTFTTLWDLMHAYEWYPDRFGDNTGIPESGNGVPDILDEIKYELDWLLRMQRVDGALYSGVFVTSGGSGGLGDPSTETTTYYYANFSTAATVTGAMAFALGARLFQPFNFAYSTTLRTAAENAWAFLEANPNNIQYNHSGFQNANANWDDATEKQGRVAAAAELWHLTGATKYRDYVDANYNNPNTRDGGWHQPIINGYFETGASAVIQRGLVSYCLAPGSTSSVVTAIKNSLNQGILNQTYGQRNADAYKAFIWDGHYCWGSNSIKGEWANLALWGIKLNVNPSLETAYRAAAEEYLHYFHGRNPLAWSYITQSNSAGADKQITQIYHGWFWDGTTFDTNPAPGFLAGGPNANYVQDTQSSGGTPVYPPGGEPRQKAYRDWNTNWPDCSWSVTEPGIYYQARYVFLCAAFAGVVSTPTNTPTNTPYAGTPTFTWTRTNTPTNTPFFSPTPTSTATTPPPYILIYDGDTAGYRLSDGTVNNGSPGTMTEGVYGVTGNGMRLTYTSIQSWWQEHWWDKTTNVNIGANTYLVFNVRQAPTSPNPVNQLYVRINWTNIVQVDPNYIVGGGSIDTTWKEVRVPLSVLITAGQTVIDFIGFAASWNRDYTVDIDNIRLEGASVTPTNTPAITNTRTRTATPTWTGTPTPTSSSTWTSSPSATYTWTSPYSATPTLSYTNTFTSSRTLTPTWTQTSTSTATPTATSSRTWTLTYTPTRTSTPTLTYTDTGCLPCSPTVTPTWTRTSTRTEIPTVTWTWTETKTVTSTASPTFSLTFTPTSTHTRTFTPTYTPTSTRTATPTVTYTVTTTITQTHSISPTFTDSVTGTPPTLTNTPTMTLTSTVTSTPTFTFTRTFTPTYTQTSTIIPSTTSTATSTNTITPSWTRTLTITLQPTMSFTFTPTQTQIENQVFKIENLVIIPNPYNPDSGNLKIGFDLTQSCMVIKFRIFTAGFRFIMQQMMTGNYSIGINNIEIYSKYLQDLANGVYYIQLEAINNAGESAKSKPVVLVILR